MRYLRANPRRRVRLAEPAQRGQQRVRVVELLDGDTDEAHERLRVPLERGGFERLRFVSEGEHLRRGGR